VKALAHITGGRLPENLPRVLPADAAAHVDAAAWTPPAGLGWLAGVTKAGSTEMLRTFNCGVGRVLVCSAEHADEVLAMLAAAGEPAACRIGCLTARADGAPQVDVRGTDAWGWA